MRSASWFGAMLAFCCITADASAQIGGQLEFKRVSRRLHGTIVDYTHNHGCDRRIWSPALGERRDLYVYLPPGYDPSVQYPFILYLHGFGGDEAYFIKNQIEPFDRLVACGQAPPAIIAVPDGSIKGRPSFFNSASFFLNSRAGCFEDYVMHDVWNFVMQHYPIRPEREAHAVIGVSMGGMAAFHLAFKYPERFKIIVGFHPAVNLRWVDCHGHYRAKFDPCCWGWRTDYNPNEVIARYYLLLTIRLKVLMDPLFGRAPDVIEQISRVNPIEMLHAVQKDQFSMYIAYAGKDQFNIDAQVESFLYRAREQGLTVDVGYDPNGHHDLKTGLKLFPGAMAWLSPKLAPYAPVLKIPLSKYVSPGDE